MRPKSLRVLSAAVIYICLLLYNHSSSRDEDAVGAAAETNRRRRLSGGLPQGRVKRRKIDSDELKTKACFDFQKGNCTRNTCKFLHVKGRPARRPEKKSREICWDHLKAGCHRGDKCRFEHVPTPSPTPAAYSHAVDKPCRMFAVGKCVFDEMCRFRHDK
mmetsp:Transcript_11797/g.16335  ORF Transcript_11797/g.16335 Transcript_11797/m.16335 type:complete len:160 (-) Transcript_11797:77-556(-)